MVVVFLFDMDNTSNCFLSEEERKPHYISEGIAQGMDGSFPPM
jgi:hypothetical protein